MSGAAILFAAGAKGITLNVPEGVNVEVVASAIDSSPPKSESEQRALVAMALENPEYGQALSKLAAIKRRAAILVGDLSRPAPYDVVLPAIIENLVKAGIRPSRIAVFACPGGSGPLLGRGAIHRYGEAVCGNHEIAAWPAEGTPGELYTTADLRIAVASHTGQERFESFIRGNGIEVGMNLKLGKRVSIDVEGARVYGPAPDKVFEPHPVIQARAADVWITSSGGGPWEATLEEALLSLRAATARSDNPAIDSMAQEIGVPAEQLRAVFTETQSEGWLTIPSESYSPVSAQSAVLVFSGAEGIGSAQFAQDVWSLIEQAEEVLAAGKALNLVQKPGAPYDPASTLAECLSRYKNTVLYAPEFCAHSEGEDLGERIAAAPNVAKRLALCGAERELWPALELLHGTAYTLAAQPLGWRGF